MSRRKDRDRVQSMKRLDPDYRGFRGYDVEPSRGRAPLESVTCIVCGRTRNVPHGIAEEQRDTLCLHKLPRGNLRPAEVTYVKQLSQ